MLGLRGVLDVLKSFTVEGAVLQIRYLAKAGNLARSGCFSKCLTRSSACSRTEASFSGLPMLKITVATTVLVLYDAEETVDTIGDIG